MAKYEQKTGGKLLAIPHNGNLSNGRMFALTDFAGKPLTATTPSAARAGSRCRRPCRPRATSETHPTLSPNDEFADFGIAGWEYGNLTLEGKPQTPDMLPYKYMRGA